MNINLLSIEPMNLSQLRKHFHEWRLARQWVRVGQHGPPPHLIKEKAVCSYAARFSAQTLVETGTYQGDMVYACRNHFRRIISIELDRVLFEKAKHRFADYPHVTIVHGDSAMVLSSVIEKSAERYLFWLDGHYSAGETARGERETPVIEELHQIKSLSDDPVILIDDARLFAGLNDYPTLDELESVVKGLWKNSVMEVRDDIIRIVPAQEGVQR